MGKRVLIVEDDALVADQLAALVEDQLDCVPLVTASIRDALGLIDVDFGFLDIAVTDGQAFAVASRLRELGVPFVFVSASDPASVPADLATAPFLRKPVAAPALLAAARQHL
jgi:DNA-binding response OmpR family regulator